MPEEKACVQFYSEGNEKGRDYNVVFKIPEKYYYDSDLVTVTPTSPSAAAFGQQVKNKTGDEQPKTSNIFFGKTGNERLVGALSSFYRGETVSYEDLRPNLKDNSQFRIVNSFAGFKVTLRMRPAFFAEIVTGKCGKLEDEAPSHDLFVLIDLLESNGIHGGSYRIVYGGY